MPEDGFRDQFDLRDIPLPRVPGGLPPGKILRWGVAAFVVIFFLATVFYTVGPEELGVVLRAPVDGRPMISPDEATPQRVRRRPVQQAGILPTGTLLTHAKCVTCGQPIGAAPGRVRALTPSGLWRNCGVAAFNMCSMVNMLSGAKSR